METDEPIDGTKLPVKKKPVKPNTVKKLIERAVINVMSDNPVGTLNSLVESESFRIECVSHDKVFKGIVYIDGKVFESVAFQKKKARELAVIRALEHVFRDVVQEICDALEQMRKNNAVYVQKPQCILAPATLINTTLQPAVKLTKLHVTEQQLDKATKKAKVDNSNASWQQLAIRKDIKSRIVERVVGEALGLTECENPNTVTALYSLFEKDCFQFIVEPEHDDEANFRATLRINGKEYTDTGSSMKKAKSNVTKIALRELFPEIAVNKKPECKNTDSSNGISERAEDTSAISSPEIRSINGFTFSDFVASAIQSKYNAIMESQPEYLKRYSVLSGIVMVRNDDLNDSSVICVCTGNKCLLGDRLSTAGDVLLDCHAEILARRCLISFIYAQLYAALTSQEQNVLDVIGQEHYRVKDNVKFYLYISSAPCGDGRVFNFGSSKNPDRPKQANKRGILRVKLESGMGGIPVTEYSSTEPTFQDYMTGRPLVIMCCSEKLLRANVLGMQGALLSHLVEPIYLSGLLIGNIFHQVNLARAIYGRLNHLEPNRLQPPYRLNKPQIEGITNSKIAINVKPGKSCMNWIINDPTVEFINTKTGKTIEDNPSRLCKLNLFRKFADCFLLFGNLDSSTITSISYKAYKENAQRYQRMKNLVYQCLESSGRGKWLRTARELDLFFLNDGNSVMITDELQ